MIKGVNRQIIEVTDINNSYFERAWLVIKPQYMNCGASSIENEADKYLKNLKPPYTLRNGRTLIMKLIRLLSAALVGSLVTALLFQAGIL